MIAKKLIDKIRSTKGPILAGLTNFSGVIYVQVSKKDLLQQIKHGFKPDEETGFELDDEGFLDKDYSSN